MAERWRRGRRSVAVAVVAIAAASVAVGRPVPEVDAAVPETVAGLWAVDGLNGVVLEWFAPMSGDPATGYEYAISTDGGTNFSAFTAVPATISTSSSNFTRVTTTITSGLTRGTETIFQIRALNADGPGAAFPDPAWFGWPTWSVYATAKISDPCDPMTDCDVGDVGPAGGLIVYDRGSNAAWGRYIESAPAFWNGSSGDPLAYFGCDGTLISAAAGSSAQAIGAAPANATAIMAGCATAGIATRVADAHSVTVGGVTYDDWHIPSIGDLDAMYAYRQKLGGWKYGGMGGSDENYSSSTDFHSSNFYGINGSKYKVIPQYVRPMRYVMGPDAPSAPGVSTLRGDTRIDITWTAPTNDGGNPVSDYEVRYSSDGGSNWGSWTSVGLVTSHALTGLVNGDEHVVEVRALNRGGRGAVASANATPATTPGAPTSVAATPGPVSLDITWTAPSSTGGSPIADHEIRVSSDNGTTWGSWTATGSSASRGTIAGLDPSLQYIAEVRAINGVGAGPAAASTAAVTPNTTTTTTTTTTTSTTTTTTTTTTTVPVVAGSSTSIPEVAPSTSSTTTSSSNPPADSATVTTTTLPSRELLRRLPVAPLVDGVVLPGRSATLTGTGFAAGESVEAYLVDDTVDPLGSSFAAADGAARLDVTVPNGLSGTVEFALWGPGSGHGIRQSLTIGSLPNTGSGDDAANWALLVLSVGALVAVFGTRRRPGAGHLR